MAPHLMILFLQKKTWKIIVSIELSWLIPLSVRPKTARDLFAQGAPWRVVMWEVFPCQVIEYSSAVTCISHGYFTAKLHMFFAQSLNMSCGVCVVFCRVWRAKSLAPIESKHLFVWLFLCNLCIGLISSYF